MEDAASLFVGRGVSQVQSGAAVSQPLPTVRTLGWSGGRGWLFAGTGRAAAVGGFGRKLVDGMAWLESGRLVDRV